MKDVVNIKDLTMRFGKKTVLSDVNISIKSGEVYGIVGNNGVGKTTLLKLVCGLLKPVKGSITFGTGDEKPPVIGTLIESPGLYGDMSAYANIKAKSLCMGLKYTKKDIQELLETVGLGDVGKKSVRAFSMGMKQRLAIALALVGEPELLILDEPINGLDPQGINEIRNLVLKVHEKYDVSIMISSHILGELAKVVTRFCVIDKGRIIKECSKEEFMTECGEKDINEYYLEIISSAAAKKE